jgi:transposase-like protein
MATYSAAFIEQALQKTYSRGDRTIMSVATDLNLNHHTLRYWMKKQSALAGSPAPEKEKRPSDWTLDEQLQALHESHALSGEQLQAWCRERGLFPHNLTSWKAAFCAGSKEAAPKAGEVKSLKDENVKLKRELVRKDKALAEAAALLVLQKKFRALWEGEES